MRKNLTEIVFILDRSGSMSGLERDTIGGFNSMIEKQKKAEGEALISTVLFPYQVRHTQGTYSCKSTRGIIDVTAQTVTTLLSLSFYLYQINTNIFTFTFWTFHNFYPPKCFLLLYHPTTTKKRPYNFAAVGLSWVSAFFRTVTY